jgi:hypothetical protein
MSGLRRPDRQLGGSAFFFGREGERNVGGRVLRVTNWENIIRLECDDAHTQK